MRDVLVFLCRFFLSHLGDTLTDSTKPIIMCVNKTVVMLIIHTVIIPYYVYLYVCFFSSKYVSRELSIQPFQNFSTRSGPTSRQLGVRLRNDIGFKTSMEQKELRVTDV